MVVGIRQVSYIGTFSSIEPVKAVFAKQSIVIRAIARYFLLCVRKNLLHYLQCCSCFYWGKLCIFSEKRRVFLNIKFKKVLALQSRKRCSNYIFYWLSLFRSGEEGDELISHGPDLLTKESSDPLHFLFVITKFIDLECEETKSSDKDESYSFFQSGFEFSLILFTFTNFPHNFFKNKSWMCQNLLKLSHYSKREEQTNLC